MKKETVELIKRLLITELNEAKDIVLTDALEAGSKMDVAALDAYKLAYDTYDDFCTWEDKNENA